MDMPYPPYLAPTQPPDEPRALPGPHAAASPYTPGRRMLDATHRAVRRRASMLACPPGGAGACASPPPLGVPPPPAAAGAPGLGASRANMAAGPARAVSVSQSGLSSSGRMHISGSGALSSMGLVEVGGMSPGPIETGSLSCVSGSRGHQEWSSGEEGEEGGENSTLQGMLEALAKDAHELAAYTRRKAAQGGHGGRSFARQSLDVEHVWHGGK